MKIAIIGATGGTGISFIEQATARGHEITALARTPAKLNAPMRGAPHLSKKPYLNLSMPSSALWEPMGCWKLGK
jgi:nucleoside-diphosphate-sugar epimerase